MLTALVFILILSILVLVHELGHFLVAKKMGVRVDEFGFGLPPRIFGKKIGETIYSINLLPFGGFVKLYGEDETGEKLPVKDAKRAFFAKTAGQRLVIVAAGVIMNSILAAVIFYGFLTLSNFKTELPLLFNHQFFAVNQTNKTEIIISKVAPSSPAEKAGIKRFSKVISVNGEGLKSEQDFKEVVDENRGKKISFKLQDLESLETYSVEVVPRVSPPENEGPLGVGFSPARIAVLSYQTPIQKIFSGITHPFNLLVYNLKIIGQLIAISFSEKTAAPVGEAVAGPVGIFSLVDQIVQIPNLKERVLQALNFIGILSVSLAFFNILPIPALDGGRLFFIGIEAVIGRRIKPKVEAMIHQIGFILLIALIFWITYNDLLRLNLFQKLRSLFP